MAKEKLPSGGFFGNFSTDIDDDSTSNLDAPANKKNENGADVVDKLPAVDFQDDDEDEDKVEDKKVEDTEDKEEEKVEDKVEDTDEDGDDPFIATINHLAEKGLLSYDEEKEYEEEGEELLEVVFQETLEKRFQEEYVDTIPEDYQSILKHLKAGKPLEDWVEAFKPTDYDSINLEDEGNQKQLIEDHLTLTGMDEEDIKDRLQELEDLGTLEKAAKTAVKYLKKADASKASAYEAELDKEIKAQEAKATKDLEDFKKEVLTTEKLKDFDIPKAKREKLLDHITKPVNRNGESQFVINQKSRENQLLLAYLDMEGYSLKDIKKAVETKVTSGLRKSLSHFSDTNAKGAKGATAKVQTEGKRIPKGVWDVDTTIEE